jgi:membrane protein YqaA with SNARE-associated domain
MSEQTRASIEPPGAPGFRKISPSRSKRTLFLALEIVFIAGLLVWWLTDASIRRNKSLWVCFFYCFPSEFLIATVPHEPVILYFGKFYPALTVALVSVTGTCLTEILNYSAFGYVADLRLFRKFTESRAVRKTVGIFNRAPFLALWVAGVSPIPFYPFRFLVVLSRYPLWKYILAVFTSRAPRMFLIALAGRLIRIPDSLLLGLVGVLIIAANVPLLRGFFARARGKRTRPENPPGFHLKG